MKPLRAFNALTLAAAAALSGCASMAPPVPHPPLPVAEHYPNDASTTAAANPAAELPWQQMMADARMARVIELALQNNRDLRVAVASIEQARGQAQAQGASLYPTIGAGLIANRQPVFGQVATSYTAGLALSTWEIDLFGRLRSLSNSAQARLLASEEARRAAQASLVAAVAATYLNTVADDELLALTPQTLATREESLRLVKLKFDNGATSELDLRQAESLVENARAALAAQQRQRQLDENALVLLAGQALPADLPAGQPLTALQLGPELPAGLPAELLTRRPDVRSAEAQLVAANANIGAARAAFLPAITLTGSAGSASGELSGLFKSGTFAWTATAQLLAPIFDGGRNRGNLAAAEAGRDIALAQYEKSIQSAFREVADALAGRATLGEQLRAQRAQAAADEQRYKLAELRYRNGVASSLDLLDAQRSLFLTQQQSVQVQLALLQNQIALYKALGGGWTEPAR